MCTLQIKKSQKNLWKFCFWKFLAPEMSLWDQIHSYFWIIWEVIALIEDSTKIVSEIWRFEEKLITNVQKSSFTSFLQQANLHELFWFFLYNLFLCWTNGNHSGISTLFCTLDSFCVFFSSLIILSPLFQKKKVGNHLPNFDLTQVCFTCWWTWISLSV
jgi:hypothetical protein